MRYLAPECESFLCLKYKHCICYLSVNLAFSRVLCHRTVIASPFYILAQLCITVLTSLMTFHLILQCRHCTIAYHNEKGKYKILETEMFVYFYPNAFLIIALFTLSCKSLTMHNLQIKVYNNYTLDQLWDILGPVLLF